MKILSWGGEVKEEWEEYNDKKNTENLTRKAGRHREGVFVTISFLTTLLSREA